MTGSDSDSTVEEILARNARVELDKAWETSWTRRLSITILTYAITTYFLWSIENEAYLLNALVPAGGYLLSTLSLPWMKKVWMSIREKD